MSRLGPLRAAARRWIGRVDAGVWYSPHYRLPLASAEAVGIDSRRADLAAEYLLEAGILPRHALRAPERIGYDALGRVHTRELLERLQEPAALAEVFAVDPSEVVPEELWVTLRLACGATLAAARHALRRASPALNLLGGFHHATPTLGGGFCPVNDVAVAIAALRSEGFAGDVAVLDLDAHPPDGIAACFANDRSVRIASISAVDWGPLPGVDETVLPPGAGDGEYLSALRRLLARFTPAALNFVIAGGDVLAGDRHGGLALSLAGVARRDQDVAAVLHRHPSVWLPGGGYGQDAWRALAGTATVLLLGEGREVPASYDALERRFRAIALGLDRSRLEGEPEDERLLLADLGRADLAAPRFLGYYTAEGLEYACERYGLFAHLRRLGYDSFRVATDREPRGHRLRVFGVAARVEHLLVECVLDRRRLDADEYLYVHWLTLRNPRARFRTERPRLPGQEVPGLGLAREAGELLARAADRLGLAGVLLRPAWYHTALQAHHMGMRFLDPARQGRFEAMIRDLSRLPLREVTLAAAEGRVRMNGAPYRWEAEVMARGVAPAPAAAAAIAAERARVGFEVV
ncbi:MAG TPA: hypothetical protein PLU22_02715 [Polyangiaceae bacterium]|nr:hypothetical protein [Polyangiaceae bacterium]